MEQENRNEILLNEFILENKRITKLSNNKPTKSFNNISTIFSSIRFKISELPFEKVTVEIINTPLTPQTLNGYDNYIKFTMFFPEERMLMFNVYDKYSYIHLQFEYTVTFSFFIQKELIYTDTTEFEKFLLGFKAYFSK